MAKDFSGWTYGELYKFAAEVTRESEEDEHRAREYAMQAQAQMDLNVGAEENALLANAFASLAVAKTNRAKFYKWLGDEARLNEEEDA